MAIGDPLQAAALGHEALNAAGIIRSRRAAEALRELAATLLLISTVVRSRTCDTGSPSCW
jgi:hypothetical protein